MAKADISAKRKPALTIEQQINHLKRKGVKFERCSEEQAADYLAHRCNFFKLASYRKLFSKCQGGERDGCHIALNFAQLRLLASHYDLKSVKSVRNCGAHNSCMINSFADQGESRICIAKSVVRAASAAKVSKATRSKWMSRPAMQQIATVLVTYGTDSHTPVQLHKLKHC